MQKIPTLFIRDPDNPKRLTREVNPDCKWVLDGEGRPTEKLDGSACAVIDGQLYKRHQHKSEKGDPPEGWIHWTGDPAQRSGHGWLVCTRGDPSCRYHWEAWDEIQLGSTPPNGTYELLGPKSNGNPHRLSDHQLCPHGAEFDRNISPIPRSYEGLEEWLGDVVCEGIVWHHPDGRMAKIKRRDFGIPWPPKD